MSHSSNKTGHARNVHRWSDDELDRLVELVDSLETEFAAAREAKKTHIMWGQIPGRLGILVTPTAATEMYRKVKRERERAAAKAAAIAQDDFINGKPVPPPGGSGIVPPPPTQITAEIELTPVVESVDSLRDVLAALDKAEAIRTATHVRFITERLERLESQQALIVRGLGEVQTVGELLNDQFAKLFELIERAPEAPRG